MQIYTRKQEEKLADQLLKEPVNVKNAVMRYIDDGLQNTASYSVTLIDNTRYNPGN